MKARMVGVVALLLLLAPRRILANDLDESTLWCITFCSDLDEQECRAHAASSSVQPDSECFACVFVDNDDDCSCAGVVSRCNDGNDCTGDLCLTPTYPDDDQVALDSLGAPGSVSRCSNPEIQGKCPDPLTTAGYVVASLLTGALVMALLVVGAQALRRRSQADTGQSKASAGEQLGSMYGGDVGVAHSSRHEQSTGPEEHAVPGRRGLSDDAYENERRSKGHAEGKKKRSKSRSRGSTGRSRHHRKRKGSSNRSSRTRESGVGRRSTSSSSRRKGRHSPGKSSVDGRHQDRRPHRSSSSGSSSGNSSAEGNGTARSKHSRHGKRTKERRGSTASIAPVYVKSMQLDSDV